MKLKYLLSLLIVFILSIFYDPIWLKLRFGCSSMDFGNKYTVWMECQEKKGVDFGVVDYKFSRGKLFVKRYIVHNYDESFIIVLKWSSIYMMEKID
ncbi:hypothetical protein [Exercitatus varius]|uniref:hypothetical protein n=1 Tax=Exercitatus varius TaxID=67857 RepID=UPI00294AE961|nr:hypothetical protein [Exercitatus varius]MDG2958474.1 hypothetical protein [Exercitatus varius]